MDTVVGNIETTETLALGGGTVVNGGTPETAGSNTVAIGSGAMITGANDSATAIGYNALTANYQTLAVGEQVSALSPSAVALGSKAIASTATSPLSVGYRTVSTGNRSIAIGGAVSVSDGSGDYPGNTNWSATISTGDGSIAIGKAAKSLADGAIQLGMGSNTNANTMAVFGYPLVDVNGDIIKERIASSLYDIELTALLSKAYQDEVTGEWYELAVSNGVIYSKSIDILSIYDTVWRKAIANRDVTAYAINHSAELFGDSLEYEVKAKIALNSQGPRIIECGDGTFDVVSLTSFGPIRHTYPKHGYYLIQAIQTDIYAPSSNSFQVAIVKAYKLSSAQDTAYGMFSYSKITSLEGFTWGGCINGKQCFYGCRSLRGRVPTFEGSKVNDASFAFRYCGLQEIGEDFTWGLVANATYAFGGCSSITNIASSLTDEVLMPETVQIHGNCVSGASTVARQRFTTGWGGTRSE